MSPHCKKLAFIVYLLSAQSHANVIQYFTGISYFNPAELTKTKSHEMVIGATSFYTDAKFSGSVLNLNTSNYVTGNGFSRTASLLPYGRIAKRINQKWVMSLDLTEPFHSNLDWGDDRFTRYAATQTYLTDIDISPKIGYSFTPSFHGGFGLNFNVLKNNETNWALPDSLSTASVLVNKTSSFGLGYNIGAMYLINPLNILSATYYSRIPQHTRGYSHFNGVNVDDVYFNFSMPATTILNYVHIINPSWLVSLQLFRTEWNVNQQARYFQTAAPTPPGRDFVFQMHYDESHMYVGALRHQYNPKLGLTLIGVIDNGPEQNSLRTINFPSDTQYLLGLNAEYAISEKTTLQLFYGHVYSKTLIQNRIQLSPTTNLAFTTGRVHINADVIDLRFKIIG
jgi:long-chain fatty acid transport protein